MASFGSLDRRARRCLTGDCADDEGDIDDSVFDEYDSVFAAHVQGFAQSCSQGRRRCFDGSSPIEDDGFSDDDEMNSTSDFGMLKQRRREVSSELNGELTRSAWTARCRHDSIPLSLERDLDAVLDEVIALVTSIVRPKSHRLDGSIRAAADAALTAALATTLALVPPCAIPERACNGR